MTRLSKISSHTATLLLILLLALTYSGARAATEDLDEIIVSISPDQVVGVPLIGTQQVFLLDSLANPVVGYDLAASPITLSTETGQLNPSVLDNPADLINGVINLGPLGISHDGLSGLHTITASNGPVSSSGLIVSFNGYDILSAFDITGNAVTTVYSGLRTSLNVEVRNGGSMIASTDPYVKAFFTSDISGSVKRYFTPAANHTLDTIQFMLENTVLEIGPDTLMLVLRSDYDIGGVVYGTEDTTRIPVEVLDPAVFAVDPGSVSPTAIYAGPDFNFAFEVETVDFAGPIDSTFLNIDLVEFEGGPVLANIFNGTPELSSRVAGFLTYDSVAAKIDTASGLAPGDYLIAMDYRLISGANIFTLTDPTPGNLTILTRVDIDYVSNTLLPRTVAVERETQFEFDLQYWFRQSGDMTSQLELDAATSSFEIYGPSFSAQTNLVFVSDTLENNYDWSFPYSFTVKSEKIIIPQAQLGESLSARASFRFRHLQSGNYLTFEVEFDTEPIEVIEFPLAQLIEVRSVSYNQSRVNTDQAFQLAVTVASQSLAEIPGLILKLTSDGDSKFDTLVMAADILPFDTITVLIDIIAGVEADVTETFFAEIIEDSIGVMPPIDANATISIDSPADISVTCELSLSARDSLLERNENFSLLISYSNQGTAGVSAVPFMFTTNGVDLGVQDPTVGILLNDTNLVYLMTAPSFDTIINLTFDISSAPIDQNTGLPTPIEKLGFMVPLEVASTQAEMVVKVTLPGEVLLIPGSRVPVLDIELTNSGSSVQTVMILNSLLARLADPLGDSINARTYIESGESGFYEDGVKLGQADLGGDRFVFNFDDFIIEAKQSRTMQMVLKLQDDLPGPFLVQLAQEDFDLEFLDDRLQNHSIPVETPDGRPLEFIQEFQSTGTSTNESFVIETNPYNPTLGEVRFAYILTEPSEVAFRLFTLTGELVHEQILALGEPGTDVTASPHMLTWDGTNDAGHIVLNGIYLAHLSVKATGHEAMIKVAVIK